jgi:DNA repair exonuclease SbcCD ATPase subunit
VADASPTAARQQLANAETIIDNYFRRLTNHPAIDQLKLNVQSDPRTGRNSYEFIDREGHDLRPVLSQGDMNALALAIFLGLACAAENAKGFGFLMLDDPSQSLGSEHKARLAEILNEVLEKKAVILSTMDVELRELLSAKITKKNRTYLFAGWTPADGPVIQPA